MAKNEYNFRVSNQVMHQSVLNSLDVNDQEKSFFQQPYTNNLENVESLRYYEYICPPFPYEPTRDKIQIVETNSAGEGIIALKHFAPGEIVFTFAGSILPYQTLYTLQIEEGKYIEDPIVMGKILHSCNPNMHCNMSSLTFTAIKPIQPYEFLFMDYDSTEDELFRHFDCCCGAEVCRGVVKGKKYQNKDILPNTNKRLSN